MDTENEKMMPRTENAQQSSKSQTQEKQNSSETFNYYLDYEPLTQVKWRRGARATEMGLRLGILTEADLEK